MKYINENVVKELFEDTPQLIFEVTEGCNFACKYCGYGDNYIQSAIRPLHANRDMQWDTAQTVLDMYLSIWRKTEYHNRNIIISFYGGEPLLNFPLIKQIVNYVKDNKPEIINIHYQMTTNGYLVKKYLSFLVENDFKIDVSLDGDQIANSYRRFMNGKETFSIVKSNLDYIQNSFPEYFKNNLSFQSVLNKNSSIIDVLSFFKKEYNTTSEIIEMSKKNLCKGSLIPELFRNVKRDIESSFRENPKEFSELNLASPTENNVRTCIKRVIQYNYETYLDFFQMGDAGSSPKRISMTCHPFTSRIFVSSTGYLFPCEKTSFKYPLGQIKDKKIDIDYNKISNLYNTLYSSAEVLCSQCLNERACTHCFLQEGELSAEGIIHCSDFIKKTDRSIKEQKQYIAEHIEELVTILNKEK